MSIRNFALPASILGTTLLMLGQASAQQQPNYNATPPGMSATVNDPLGPLPNPKSIFFKAIKDLKFEGNSITLWGDPNKEGSPYAVVQRWMPGNFSSPHMHSQDRMIYVISGTWWVSDATVKDERTTYPMTAGTYVTHPANTVHWDGNRAGAKEPAILLITGIGPARNTPVDEKGNPRPRPAGGGRGE
jgi:quercetin dioxygenase-like cupin family protein